MPDAKKTESIIWEARARIIWGEPTAQISEWMKEQGLDQSLIDDTILTCQKERAVEIRKRGIGELIIGSSIITVMVVVFLVLIYFDVMLRISVVVVLYGVYRLIRGIDMILSGGRMKGSVTDITQDGILQTVFSHLRHTCFLRIQLRAVICNRSSSLSLSVRR
jgi:hypothetical protein